jgi:hypothetical protein
MTKSVTTTIAVIALVAGLSAQKKTDASLTGTWNMGLQGGHVIPVALVLKQEGTTLSGTVALPTQHIGQTVDVPLTGEIANGVFTLSGTVEGAKEPATIEIKGTLTDEGTLDGTVAMQGHDMPYTAERLKERK